MTTPAQQQIVSVFQSKASTTPDVSAFVSELHDIEQTADTWAQLVASRHVLSDADDILVRAIEASAALKSTVLQRFESVLFSAQTRQLGATLAAVAKLSVAVWTELQNHPLNSSVSGAAAAPQTA